MGADVLMAKTKPTGLAAFTRARESAPAAAPAAAGDPAPARDRRRGKGELVALTVRLPRGEWERLHQLATAEGTSLQALAVDGLSHVLTARGLAPLAG
jgi:hypothetical protein